MGHTYSQLLIHAVFSTRERQPIIAASFRQRLYEYMSGIARQEFGAAIRLGGAADHVHGLIRLNTSVSVAEAMNRWKSLSSGWVNETFAPGIAPGFAPGAANRFHWQTGYGAFSVSQSGAEQVIRYIENQEAHHRVVSFQEEFITFLAKHEVQYDPKTIWE